MAQPMTFAEKAKEISRRYGVKKTEDLANLNQVDLKSYNLEMGRLKDKQENFKKNSLPQPKQPQGNAGRIDAQMPQYERNPTIDPKTQGQMNPQGQTQFGMGGGISKYWDGGDPLQKTNYGQNTYNDEPSDYVIESQGYDSANHFAPYKGTVKMSSSQAAEYNRLAEQLDDGRQQLLNKYGHNKLINENSEPIIAQLRQTQTKLRDLNIQYSNKQSPMYASKGIIEGSASKDQLEKGYTADDFFGNNYWGDKSQAYTTKATKVSPTDTNTPTQFQRNPNAQPWSSTGANVADAASAIATTLPYIKRTNAEPISLQQEKAGYLNYAPDRATAIQQGQIQGQNMASDLVNSGASRGQIAQGLVQGRLGLNRQTGNILNNSFQNEANQNAQIYNANQAANTGIANKQIEANYKDNRYAEEMNQLKNQQIGKNLGQFGQQVNYNSQYADFLNSRGNNDRFGNANWIPVVNAPKSAVSSPASTSSVNPNTPVKPIFNGQNMAGWGMSPNTTPTDPRFNIAQGNSKVNNYGATPQDYAAVNIPQQQYPYGGSLIGKFSFKRKR